MIEYGEKEGRMVLKPVYYGPALSGKTTNLLQRADGIAFVADSRPGEATTAGLRLKSKDSFLPV